MTETAGARYVWYGDEFIGTAETLATVAAAGLRSCLFLAPPTAEQWARVGPLDVLGIAGDSRGWSQAAIAERLAPVREFFHRLDPAVTHYQCASTFDGAAERGHLGAAMRALRSARHGSGPALVVGGQPGMGRFCAFGQLFATASQFGEVYRIDRHPGLGRPPAAPTREADLRVHLSSLGLGPVATIDLRRLDADDDESIDRAIDTFAAEGAQSILFDATHAWHLIRIGELIWRRALRRPVLTLGPGSVAQALIAAWPQARPASGDMSRVPPADGPAFLLIGSLSPVTAGQIVAAGDNCARVDLDVVELTSSPEAIEDYVRQCASLLNAGRSVIARTSVRPVPTPTPVARATSRLLSRVLAEAPAVRRICTAGSDTSLGALRELGPWAMQWAGGFGPGVPMFRVCADDPRIDGLELVLKGGQMGGLDLFARVIDGN